MLYLNFLQKRDFYRFDKKPTHESVRKFGEHYWVAREKSRDNLAFCRENTNDIIPV